MVKKVKSGKDKVLVCNGSRGYRGIGGGLDTVERKEDKVLELSKLLYKIPYRYFNLKRLQRNINPTPILKISSFSVSTLVPRVLLNSNLYNLNQ